MSSNESEKQALKFCMESLGKIQDSVDAAAARLDEREQLARNEAYTEGRIDEQRLIVEWLATDVEWTDRDKAIEYADELDMCLDNVEWIMRRTHLSLIPQIENGEHLKGEA